MTDAANLLRAQMLARIGLDILEAGDADSARAQFEQALALDPTNAEIALRLAILHGEAGEACFARGDLDGAVVGYKRAATYAPAIPELSYNLGNALRAQGKHADAVAAYGRALALRPDDAATLNNQGLSLHALGRTDEAVAALARAAALAPGNAGFLKNFGAVLRDANRVPEAIAIYREVVALLPQERDALCSLGIVLQLDGHHAEAAAYFRQAVAAHPDDLSARIYLGNALSIIQDIEGALTHFRVALEIDPNHPEALAQGVHLASRLCQWEGVGAWRTRLPEVLMRRPYSGSPFTPLVHTDDPAVHLRVAQNYASERIARPAAPLYRGETYEHTKIRVAYLSGDLQEHATAQLMAGLFEAHDRTQFEITAFSFSRSDNTFMRQRLEKAFDVFIDATTLSDEAVATDIRRREIDIAVDLKGYTAGSRPGVLAFRPAPVQVSYLGYPGTMGAPFIDTIIADRFVIPPEAQPNFTERVVYLPQVYQINDRERLVSVTPARAECDLPEGAFVFCAFNSVYKITETVFDVWTRLLVAIPDSVLWLIDEHPVATQSLRREAERRGVDAARLVFAPRRPAPQHLARHRHADLFLDTFPCTAHTTASDALFMGVPLITMPGRGFPSRVAGSLLTAVDLAELIVPDIAAYETLALRLARAPDEIARLKAHLERQRPSSPLFDTRRTCRDIEAAFTEMLRAKRR